MSVDITIQGYSGFFSSQFPREWAEYELYGSRCLYASGTFGSLLIQLIGSPPYQVLYTVSAPVQDTDVSISLPSAGLVVHCSPDHPFCMETMRWGSIVLPTHSVSLFSQPAWEATVHLTGNRFYSFFTVVYPPQVVIRQLSFFPGLDNLKTDLEAGKPVLFTSPAGMQTAGLPYSIYRILHTPFTPLSKPFYDELLLLLLTAVFKSVTTNSNKQLFTPNTIGNIISAKKWIDEHLDVHYTISELARKAGINEFKLKKGFKEMYGTGLYGYLLVQRLAIAKATLEQTTQTIRQIALKAGYKSAANFSAAFKKRFGLTPLAYRRKLPR